MEEALLMGNGVFEIECRNSTNLIPKGFAHGFLTLSDVAEVQYKASGFWNKECRSIWNDKSIDINWSKESGYIKTLLSPKDNSAPSLIEAEKKEFSNESLNYRFKRSTWKALLKLKPKGIEVIPTNRSNFNLENIDQCKIFIGKHNLIGLLMLVLIQLLILQKTSLKKR